MVALVDCHDHGHVVALVDCPDHGHMVDIEDFHDNGHMFDLVDCHDHGHPQGLSQVVYSLDPEQNRLLEILLSITIDFYLNKVSLLYLLTFFAICQPRQWQ